jgi:hypothetical protein
MAAEKSECLSLLKKVFKTKPVGAGLVQEVELNSTSSFFKQILNSTK